MQAVVDRTLHPQHAVKSHSEAYRSTREAWFRWASRRPAGSAHYRVYPTNKGNALLKKMRKSVLR